MYPALVKIDRLLFKAVIGYASVPLHTPRGLVGVYLGAFGIERLIALTSAGRSDYYYYL